MNREMGFSAKLGCLTLLGRQVAVLGAALASRMADAQYREHAANQPARLAQLDDGYDRAILVQGDEGPAQVIWLGHRWHSID